MLVSLALPRLVTGAAPPSLPATRDNGDRLAAPPPVDAGEDAAGSEVTTITRRPGAARAPLPRLERDVLDFVPLVPMGEHELSGAFQIVRVQLAGGADGPVQADVLLGEDGVARAIRVATHR